MTFIFFPFITAPFFKCYYFSYTRMTPLSLAILDSYIGLPLELIPLGITEDTIIDIEGCLSEGARPGEDRLTDPTTLAPEVKVSDWGVAADGGGLFRVTCE